MATAVLETPDLLQEERQATAPDLTLQKCVLLVEDSEEAMFLVQYALQEFGNGVYRLEWANGLSEGLERLSKGGVDIVLLDLGLPECSGPASYAWMRQVAPEVPILVLTGDTREETELTIAASGVQDYLIKDEVSGALLLQAIQAALRSNTSGRVRKLRTAVSPGDWIDPKKNRHLPASSNDSRN